MARKAFGLAFDIERTTTTRSGFKPAQYDLGAGKELFGSIRLVGFAAALRSGAIDHLVLVGGDEGRYRNEAHAVNRAEAIATMLEHDHGIESSKLSAFASRSNTGGNIEIIKREQASDDDIVITNLYHAPRASMDLRAAGLSLPIIAAEGFLLFEDRNRKNELIAMLGEGPLAERYAEEAQGVADKIAGTYQPRTDAVSSFTHHLTRC